MFERQSHAAARSQGRRAAAAEVFGQGWWWVVSGGHVLSRRECLKHARQGSADVSYNGRGRLDRVLWGGLECCLVCSCSGVNGRLSLVQYYLRKGWAGCQLEVVLHSELWGIAGTTGGRSSSRD